MIGQASNVDELNGSDTNVAEHDAESLGRVVAGCRRNDPDAQRALYDACRDLVHRLTLRMVGHADAADVAQQIFLQMFRKIGQFNGESGFRTWLYRLAINECLQFRRRVFRRPSVSLEHDPVDDASDSERRADNRELLERALEQLEPELRAIFVLREVEQLSYAEIAATLGIAEGTVASRLNRARRRLKDILIELGWEL
jgi:RNA polymerase sigma-70 factor (ECF subfamily)